MRKVDNFKNNVKAEWVDQMNFWWVIHSWISISLWQHFKLIMHCYMIKKVNNVLLYDKEINTHNNVCHNSISDVSNSYQNEVVEHLQNKYRVVSTFILYCLVIRKLRLKVFIFHFTIFKWNCKYLAVKLFRVSKRGTLQLMAY